MRAAGARELSISEVNMATDGGEGPDARSAMLAPGGCGASGCLSTHQSTGKSSSRRGRRRSRETATRRRCLDYVIKQQVNAARMKSGTRRALVLAILVPTILLIKSKSGWCYQFMPQATSATTLKLPMQVASLESRNLQQLTSTKGGRQPQRSDYSPADQASDWAPLRLPGVSGEGGQFPVGAGGGQNDDEQTNLLPIQNASPRNQTQALTSDANFVPLASQQLPQSPLSRAIEATRMFLRQQQQQQVTSQHQYQMLRLPFIQALVRHHQASQQQVTPASVQQSSSSSVLTASPLIAGKLYNFLFQPKVSNALASRPPFSEQVPTVTKAALATTSIQQWTQPGKVGRKMFQGNSSDYVATHEPFQSASSENNYQASPGTSGRQLPKGGGSLLALGAPYEQVATRTPSFPPGGHLEKGATLRLMSSASGQHSTTATSSGGNFGPTNKWLISAANSNKGQSLAMDDEAEAQQVGAAEQQTDEAVVGDVAQPEGSPDGHQAYEHYMELPPQQVETNEHQQVIESQAIDEVQHEPNLLQWNATGPPQQQVQVGSAVVRGDERQAYGGHQQQLVTDEQVDDGQQYIMVGGDLYERQNVTTTTHNGGLSNGASQAVTTPSGQNQDNKSSGGLLEAEVQRLNNMATTYLMPSTESGAGSGIGTETNSEGGTGLNSTIGGSEAGAAIDKAAALNLQSDESLLAAQLPSQYESAIRVPPEGHYDDYFKPLEGATFNEQASLLSDRDVSHSSLPHSSSVSEVGQQRASNQSYRQERPGGLYRQQPSDVTANQNGATQQLSDYTFQYYMNQQPLRQDSIGDHTLEFMTPNQSLAGNHRHRQPQTQTGSHQRLTKYVPVDGSDDAAGQLPNHTNVQQAQFQYLGPNHSPVSQQDQQQYQLVMNHTAAEPMTQATSSTSNSNNNTNDPSEGIHLIVANSSGQLQDPNTNEKLITYTSEGNRNFSQLIGKPARNTFFNKDLNESPPATAVQLNMHPSPGSSLSTTTTTRQPDHAPARFRSIKSPLMQMTNGANLKQQARQPQALPQQDSTTTERSDDYEDDPTSGDLQASLDLPAQDQESDELLHGQFGQYAGRESNQENQNPSVDPQHSSSDNNNKKQTKEPVHKHHQQDYRVKPARSNINKMHHGGKKLHRQQTIRRPQVTEAKFQLKDLALNPPTEMPSVGETTAKSISELPAKVKRIRDHQVDKNELMNELLTALDRVKAAIYKLQPLTAKMNAMYRKSVTSNTRDLIMDNHKGTYSKRYPPGDYDDTYDRMHPSELLDRQQNSGRSSNSTGEPTSRRRGRRARSNRLQASDSKASPVYLPAPRQLLEQMQLQEQEKNQILRSGNATEARRHPLRFHEGDPEEDSTESQIVASGIGRRIGSRLHSKLSLSSPSGSQIVYDDDDDDGDKADTEAARQLSGSSLLSRRHGEVAYELLEAPNSTQRFPSSANDSTVNKQSPGSEQDDEQSPVFGYRITIYQSPELEDGDPSGDQSSSSSGEERQILQYSLVDDGAFEPLPSGNAAPKEAPQQTTEEPMATSESSLVPMQRNGQGSNLTASASGAEPEFDDEPETDSGGAPEESEEDEADQEEDQLSYMEPSESTKKEQQHKESKVKKKKKKHHKKSMEADEKHKKKNKKEKGDKKGDKWSKHQVKGKKGEEEHKKKKEFKKIKHHKGLTSKESHKLHRDKHIKAHDRGAAKEKALKERTQIEFFEREQIVDDEFEKGKKSTMKAGWASGYDAKKSHMEVGEPHHKKGDSMSMGGSHYVKHMEMVPQDSSEVSATTLSPSVAASSPLMVMAASEHHHGHAAALEKGHGHSSESSSGKQSNKYEKKHMEAKGKKFKGWREKGYKIITETEFIDRGSLHDSAYKKRDKGAAHHQKFKKHEAKSEGHQGSMHEHHKKAHKKEEKKSATEAKKKEMKGKEEGEKAKKAHKKKKEEEKEHEEEKKKHKMMEQHHDHDHEESAVSSTRLQGVRAQKDHDQDEGDELGDRQPQSASPQMLTVSSTLRPSVVAIMPTYRSSNSSPITTTTTSTTQSPNRLVQRYTAKRIASANPMQQTPLPGSLTRLFQVGHDNVQFPGVARRSPSNLPQLFKVEQNNTRDSYRLVGRRSDETRQVPAQHSTTSVNNPQNAIPTTSDSPQTRPTANDATLLDIINRLNTSRSDRNSQESSYNYHHNHDNNKNELANLSPMLRLVSNLARLDQRRAMGRSNTHQPQQQPPPVVDPKPSPIVNKLSFNPQASMPTFVSPTTITTTIRPSVQPLRQQAIATTATTTSKNLHDLVGHHHSDHSNANRNHLAEYPLGPRLMPPPYDGLSVNSPSASTNQQEADQVSVFDQAALASGPQQPPQQYYMAPLTGSIPEHRPLALDPTFSFIDQSLVDYDSPSLASEYHQRQQQQLLSSLLMQQQSLVVQPGGLQRNFDFLTDR